MDQFFYEIIIESTISVLEIIQEKGVEIRVYRLMEDDMVLFTFNRNNAKWNQSLSTISGETTTLLGCGLTRIIY